MFKVLIYSDFYMPTLALIVCMALWKQIRKSEWVIFLYCLLNTLIFSTADILTLRHTHNTPLFHVNSLIELWLLSFYILKKVTGKSFSLIFWVISIGYTGFFIFNVLALEPFSVFNSNSAGLESLILLFLSMYYLLALSKSDEILHFQALPSFWIISGFLIYNAVSILVLLSYKYFTYINLPKDGDNLWGVLSVAIIVKFVLISTGLLCHKKRQTTHLPFLL